jgi:DNA-binding SARP family transcriptional activator/predicted negative regulator of RcsB-dependent stress response
MGMAAIRLDLADAPQVRLADGAVHPLALVDAQLLAWLAVHGPTRRDRLAALLWPDSPADSARNALRQRLFRLRRQCGVELIEGSNLQLALAVGVTHDLDTADTLLGTAGATLGSEFADWLDGERRRRRDQARATLAARIDALELGGDLPAALPLAEALVGLDPLREDAHRRLMRLLYLAGDRAAALRAFDRCEQQLKHELGTRPSPDTLALLATIEAAAPEPTTPTLRQAARRTLPAALMRPPRMVGRQAEFERLRAALAGGHRALVLGSAGLGKSRLLQAVAEQSPRPLWAGARPGDALVPYATLGRALRALQQVQAFELDDEQAVQLAPLLPEHSGVPPRRSPGQASPILQHDALVAALARLLDRAATTLGGIVLDDLHFADTATLQLLPELTAACTGGAWLLSSRPPADDSPTAQLLSELRTLGGWETLTLEPLDDAALAELVDSLALPDVRGERLAPMLRARSGGNPLFALETLRLAWSEGHAIEAGALPSQRNLGQLIDSVIGALSPRALLLARVAAVAGTDFSVELAEQVLRQSALELADAWAELEARQVLRGTAFSHDLVHEAVLAGIPEVLARHAHGQVAAWLDQHLGEPARVAAHWEAAGLRERALPALRAAAERAHAALREPERVAFLLRGVDIAEASERAEEAFELLSQAIEAHMNVLRDADGLPLLDRLDRLARTPHQAARSADRRAWYHTTQGDAAAAIANGRLALARSNQVDDPQLQAQASQRLGTALAMNGQFDEALPLLRAAEPWVQANAASEEAAEFEGNLAAVLDNLGRPAEAEPHHHRVIELTRVRGNHSFQATARANLSVNRLDAGDVAAAREQLALAQQLLSSFDVRGGSRGFIAALQAQVERASGHYVEALHWCDEAEALIAAAAPLRLPVVLMHRAQTLLDLGQPARAQQNLARCDLASLPPRLRARHGLLTGRLRLALLQDARAAFDAALAAAPDPGWPELRLTLRIERAEVLAPEAAGAELKDVIDVAQGLGLAGVVLAGRLRLSRRAPNASVALAAAEAALATPAGIEPNGLYRAERWLGPASAMQAAGLAERGRALAAEGWAWALDRAAALPEPWRDAFVHRQPVNLALQALAGRRPGEATGS